VFWLGVIGSDNDFEVFDEREDACLQRDTEGSVCLRDVEEPAFAAAQKDVWVVEKDVDVWHVAWSPLPPCSTASLAFILLPF
jgi:hypothetical protein